MNKIKEANHHKSFDCCYLPRIQILENHATSRSFRMKITVTSFELGANKYFSLMIVTKKITKLCKTLHFADEAFSKQKQHFKRNT
jgi:hypothetical protein